MKTVPNDQNVKDFIAKVQHPTRKADALNLLDLFGQISGEKAVMWGPSIIGFGSYHYKYDSGREGDMCRIGFSPRKAETVVYFMDGFKNHESALSQLGKHRLGKSCLYLKSLEQIDMNVLEGMVRSSWKWVGEHYPT